MVDEKILPEMTASRQLYKDPPKNCSTKSSSSSFLSCSAPASRTLKTTAPSETYRTKRMSRSRSLFILMPFSFWLLRLLFSDFRQSHDFSWFWLVRCMKEVELLLLVIMLILVLFRSWTFRDFFLEDGEIWRSSWWCLMLWLWKQQAPWLMGPMSVYLVIEVSMPYTAFCLVQAVIGGRHAWRERAGKTRMCLMT